MESKLNYQELPIFINNRWVKPKSGQYINVFNPATEQPIARIANANAADVNLAVQAAKKCFQSPAWKRLTGKDRAVMLTNISKKIQAHKDRLVLLESTNNGKPYQESVWDIDDTAACFDYYAKLAEELDGKQMTPVTLSNPQFKSWLRYEAVGVCAAVVPFNYPLLMVAWKVAPALAAGCTIVLKPSELTPLTALELADLCSDILPPGALNVVTGLGPSTGEPLVKHPDVNKVAFTGSGATGARIASLCSQDIRRCTLELGGKSAVLVFDDIKNVDQAVEWVMFGVFFNGGQVCSSTSRLLIQESIADQFLRRLVEEAQKIYVGNPCLAENREKQGMMGPLVSKSQRDKVLAFIQGAIGEGAQVLCGGGAPAQCPQGFYVAPTVLRVQPHMRIWKQEVFGPVLSVMTFRDEADAIRMANNSEFGLAAAVITDDEKRLERVTNSFEAGIVWQNCSQPTFVECPWGGVKKSGIGRELGPFGLHNYLEPKQITRYDSKEAFTWYVKPAMKAKL